MNELELRAMIRDAIRGALADVDLSSVGARVERVRVGTDDEIQQFAQRVAERCTDPVERDAIARGAVTFRLDSPISSHPPPPATPLARDQSVHQKRTPPSNEPVTVVGGAVTERHVRTAADNGGRLRMGRRARLTPLAHETVRELGVRIEKEAAR